MLVIDNKTETKLRKELEFLKESLVMVNLLLKDNNTLHYLCGREIGSVQFIGDTLLIESELNKTKMMIVKEIGRRRKNMNMLGIKSRFPNDR